MEDEKGYTEKEVELATKIANALIEEESNAYVTHLMRQLDELKAKSKGTSV